MRNTTTLRICELRRKQKKNNKVAFTAAEVYSASLYVQWIKYEVHVTFDYYGRSVEHNNTTHVHISYIYIYEKETRWLLFGIPFASVTQC